MIRRILIVLTAAVGLAVVLNAQLFWPSELEQEIQLDLISEGEIDSQTQVIVLNELKLFSFYSRYGPQRFVTLCLQQADGSRRLALAYCWREGMRWRVDTDRCRRIADWPSAEDIQSFEEEHADVVLEVVNSGYLPRPPGTEDFQPTHASIRISESVDGFEPNLNINQEALALALKNGIVPGHFALAEFHDRRWHDPIAGVRALDKSAEYLQRIMDEPECQVMDCQSLTNVLRATRERLLQADELNVKFYFLVEERSSN